MLDFARRPNKDLWNRQIQSCWEMTWTLTDNIEDSTLLDRRKQWRTYAAPEQAGVKCMMMDGWQELSGTPTHNAADLETFWKPLRESSGKMQSDLREGEYLCAIAFVKRRFPRHFETLKPTTMPSGWPLRGWKVDEGRPSVTYMAAVPWLTHVIEHANHSGQVEQRMQDFHHAAHTLTEEYGEWRSDIRCIAEAMSKKPREGKDKKWKALNGDVFFPAC
ncbi:MAG: hypothetical protein R3E95_17185 [Thiolinea sp.]